MTDELDVALTAARADLPTDRPDEPAAPDSAPRQRGRPRKYKDDAERKRAYRDRQRERANPATSAASADAADVAAAKLVASTGVRATRAELAAQLDAAAAERDALRERLARYDADPRALAGLLSGTFRVAFRIIAHRRARATWNLEPWEADDLGMAYAQALLPYWSSVAGYAPLAVAALATWGVVDGRLQVETGAMTEDEFRVQLADARRARDAATAELSAHPAMSARAVEPDVSER